MILIVNVTVIVTVIMTMVVVEALTEVVVEEMKTTIVAVAIVEMAERIGKALRCGMYKISKESSRCAQT